MSGFEFESLVALFSLQCCLQRGRAARAPGQGARAPAQHLPLLLLQVFFALFCSMSSVVSVWLFRCSGPHILDFQLVETAGYRNVIEVAVQLHDVQAAGWSTRSSYRSLACRGSLRYVLTFLLSGVRFYASI